MQCDDLDVEMPAARKINELDTSLNELTMLSQAHCPTSRQQAYLREIQNKHVLNMLSINTRYVSNVSIGFRVRPITPHVRYKPYYTRSKKEQRQRTRSENNDNPESTSIVKAVLDQTIEYCDDTAQVKKAKSLESIVLENNKELDLAGVNFKIPEVEIVSDCIERLKVDE